MLRIRREQDPVVKEKYPNLAKNEKWLNAMRFESDRDVRHLDDAQFKEFVETILERRPDEARDLDYNEVEVGSLVYFEKGGGELWQGRFRTPPALRYEHKQEENTQGNEPGNIL